MQTIVEPYLYFAGNCAEAMDFYKSVFGGELELLPNHEEPTKLMHAKLSGGLITLMASDSDRTEPYPVSQISLSIVGSDDAALRGAFGALAEGGTVTSPIKLEFWGDIFGSLTDKFGLDWQVTIRPEVAAAE